MCLFIYFFIRQNSYTLLLLFYAIETFRVELQSNKKTTKMSLPEPVFILQNSKPITCLKFSSLNKNLIYAGNRHGDLIVYNLDLRRNIFNANSNQQSLLGIEELDRNSFLTFSRNGAVFEWSAKDELTWTNECKSCAKTK